MKNIYKISIIITFLAGGTIANAQDAHLSQYGASPILLNPANTGVIENADFRIGANYRTQWGSIPSSSYTTTAISFETRIKERWGVGGYAINNDLSGFINASNIMLSASYQITDPSQYKYKITTGIQSGVMMKKNKRKRIYI